MEKIVSKCPDAVCNYMNCMQVCNDLNMHTFTTLITVSIR